MPAADVAELNRKAIEVVEKEWIRWAANQGIHPGRATTIELEVFANVMLQRSYREGPLCLYGEGDYPKDYPRKILKALEGKGYKDVPAGR